MKLLYSTLFLLCAYYKVLAQDVHLTQYYTSNLSLNPAYTGKYNGDIKVVANYRSQWGQIGVPIRTNMVSVEKKLFKYPDEIGIGFIVIHDNLNSRFQLNTNKLLVSGSYQKEIQRNIIRVGLQGGVVQRNSNLNDQTLPDQWNYSSGLYDPFAATGEPGLQETLVYPSINTGISWTRIIKKVRWHVGYSLFNVNKPKEGFISAARRVPFRHTFNTSVNVPLSSTVSITPHVLYMNTVSATDFIFGTNVKNQFNNNVGGIIGAGLRGSAENRDALFGVIGISYKRFEVGFSMDFNISSLSENARSKSSVEFSISYLTPGKISNKVTIPCDRY